MTGLLEARELIKSFYSKYEIYITPVLKLLLALVTVVAINMGMGYMHVLKNPAVCMIVALLCSFMPFPFIVFVGAVYILLHTYALAVECAIVVLAVFAILFLVYLRFVPKDTMVVLLTPLLFFLKIPYVMPVVMGLLGGPASILSVSSGVVVYYMVKVIADNVTIFSAMDAQTGSQKFRVMLDGILDNKAMLITIVIFALVLVLVYTIKRMSIDHAWTVAIITGLMVGAILLLICVLVLDLDFSVLGVLLGSLISFFVCLAVQFMEFNVDYSRTELVQFEDDEYYYYVKAIPKNVVTVQEKKVKQINKQHKKATAKQVKQVKTTGTIKTSHGVTHSAIREQEVKKNKKKQDLL